jgi:hypothetical protein
MAIHNVRYFVRPRPACPEELKTPWGLPNDTCEVDTDFVARCAIGEILQTSKNLAPMSALFEELLAPGGTELIWRGRGPGRGIEMRRAFSGLFGRFFARAYLQRYHGFTWFVPIDGCPTILSNRARIVQKPGSSAEMPDWFCAQPGQVAVAEAKGSHQRSNVTAQTLPGPLKTAEKQIGGVVLEIRSFGRSGVEIWTARSVKGWAVMSRWGVEEPDRDAFQYVLDPSTDGEPLSDGDREHLVQDVARLHVAQTLEGMGYPDLASEFGVAGLEGAARPRQTATIEIEGEPPIKYLGAVVGPFGLLHLTLDRARAAAAAMPPELASQIRFVGMQIDDIRRLRDQSDLEPRPVRRSADGTSVGPDGLVFAQIGRVRPLQIEI